MTFATVLFGSEMMQLVRVYFSATYSSKCHLCAFIPQCKENGEPSEEAFCLDSIVHGHHLYRTVWTPFLGRFWLLPQSPRTNTTGMLCVCRRMGRSSATYFASHLQLLSSVLCNRDDYYKCHEVWCLFEGGYYFTLLFFKCGLKSRVATKWGVASIKQMWYMLHA